jgi:hypothetical protein
MSMNIRDWFDHEPDDFERHDYHQMCVQSGVQALEDLDGKPESSKHLRVGINTALVDHAALAELLIAKGLITRKEYAKALADAMEREHRRLEAAISKRVGSAVSLGPAGALST